MNKIVWMRGIYIYIYYVDSLKAESSAKRIRWKRTKNNKIKRNFRDTCDQDIIAIEKGN